MRLVSHLPLVIFALCVSVIINTGAKIEFGSGIYGEQSQEVLTCFIKHAALVNHIRCVSVVSSSTGKLSQILPNISLPLVIYTKTEYSVVRVLESLGCFLVVNIVTHPKNINVIRFEANNSLFGSSFKFINLLENESIVFHYFRTQYNILNCTGLNTNYLYKFCLRNNSFINSKHIETCRNNSTVKEILGGVRTKKYTHTTLRVATYNIFPYFISNDEINSMKQHDGIEFKILNTLSETLGFKYRIKLFDNEKWGQVRSDSDGGSGILGSVSRCETDIGFAGLFYDYKQSLLIDYTIPYSKNCVTLLVPRPKLIPEWLLILVPFDVSCWLCVGALVIVSPILLFAFAHVQKQEKRYTRPGYSMLTVIGLLAMEAVAVPKTNWMRYITIWIMFAFMILGISYSSGLASHMTLPIFEKSIRTVQDVNDANLVWTSLDEDWAVRLNESSDADMNALLHRYKFYNFSNANDVKYLQQQIASRQMALAIILHKSGIFSGTQKIDSHILENFQTLESVLYCSHISFIVCKGSPHREKIGKSILHLTESGIISYWEHEVILKTSIRQFIPVDEEFGADVSLSLSHLQGIFFLLCFGWALSLTALVIELLYTISNTRKVKTLFKESIETRHFFP